MSYQQHKSQEHTEVSSRLPSPPRPVETAFCAQPTTTQNLMFFVPCNLQQHIESHF